MPALLERQAAASQATMEQADFAMEAEGLNRPVDVPKGALGALRKDAIVLGCLAHGHSENDVLANWFVGSLIHLGGSNSLGLVVIPRTQPTTNQPCLLGAHSMPFWVFLENHRD